MPQLVLVGELEVESKCNSGRNLALLKRWVQEIAWRLGESEA